jgi:alanyl-tRNA synthetase
MISAERVRQQFLDFFKDRVHRIVPSAPMVVKDDPTLMFTNAGMNPFKDYFLGNRKAEHTRVADTQKCLRVSGKHNDLEEVGVDTYHHTMFEMLGNWSFGDYFKSESIAWAWELLTEVYQLDKDRLYITIFEGDESDGLSLDEEARAEWSKWVDADRILPFDRKDNFWEMGDTGPCGPCSEIHIDLRPDEERRKVDGRELVNQDHEQVIELWNLVFIQFNRKADGRLEDLPNKHIDTGMGLERIVRALNGMSSNYEIDLFSDVIRSLEKTVGLTYGKDQKKDIAFRVIADHIRAIVFAIADGQLPSNEKAGYVIRRILRRAVRFGYSYLGMEEPFLYELVALLAKQYEQVFPEVQAQEELITQVIKEEETSFLRTLSKGIAMLDQKLESAEELPGEVAFELYDTFGFPIDLTRLIARERGISVDEAGFEQSLKNQRNRSKADAKKDLSDWHVLMEDEREEFIGYDYLQADVRITRYREVKTDKKTVYHVVLNLTPFYAESGGQVGDTGVLTGRGDGSAIRVEDTIKENNLIIHVVKELPQNLDQVFVAEVLGSNRKATMRNHSATHLLHAALREVLGDHVEQKGSLVDPEKLRFDFSHFSKVSDEEMAEIETLVNQKIREAIPLEEERNVPISVAKEKGAMALFGEKYGDTVRVITFDPNYSVELCGGTHVSNTAEIGRFTLVSESSVAAGIRRIEAITGSKADEAVRNQLDLLKSVQEALGGPKDVLKAIQQLQKENKSQKKRLEAMEAEAVNQQKSGLKQQVERIGEVNTLIQKVAVPHAGALKDLAFQLKNEMDQLFLVLAADVQGKPGLVVAMSDDLVGRTEWNAGKLIREFASHIKGGGGGQPFFAQAGGSDVSGIKNALEAARNWIKEAE